MAFQTGFTLLNFISQNSNNVFEEISDIISICISLVIVEHNRLKMSRTHGSWMVWLLSAACFTQFQAWFLFSVFLLHHISHLTEEYVMNSLEVN